MSPPETQPFRASPWLVAAVLLCGVGTVVLGARDMPDWRLTQQEYRVQDPRFEPGLRAAPIELVADRPTDGLEYCSSCHLAGAGYAPMDSEPFAAHPEVGHDPLEMGCVPCHRGDAASLAFHDGAAFGRDRPLTGDQAWSACLHCHDPDSQAELLAPWPAVTARAELLETMFEDHGCLACHTAGGRGGLVGPSLDSFGATPVSDATAAYGSRIQQAIMQLDAPASLQPATNMPTRDLAIDDRANLAVWLSLQGHLLGMNHHAWVPGQPDALADTDTVYRWLCQPCHGQDGDGLERGRAPGAVPALGSQLWLAYAPREFVQATIAEGRSGSMMEPFHSADGAPILSADELEALVSHVQQGALAQQADPDTYQRVAAGSCGACHVLRGDYTEQLDDAQRASFLPEHPWRWSLEDWLQDEGLLIETCDEEIAAEGEQPAVVHAGEQLYGQLCVHCHEDLQLSPAGDEPSAPALRGALQREHFDAAYLLASVIIGRPDAPPTKWRHQGIIAGEYSPQQLACLVRWLEDNP